MTKAQSPKQAAQKRQKRLMKKRAKDNVRHKIRGTNVVGENAIQHQMLSEFGSVENYIKNLHHLGEMFKTEEELKTLRFDSAALYKKMDLEDPDINEALKDLFSNDDFSYYAENWEHFWKEKRGEWLEDLLPDDFVKNTARIFKVLLQKKKGFKKEYRAILAGNLLVQSHIVALAEAPIGENNLWELMFNATLKENKIELPTPRERVAPAAPEEPAADAPAAPSEESAEKPAPSGE